MSRGLAEIDANWLFERGNLHDATVVTARALAGNVEVEIDDEWINERGLSRPENGQLPIVLSFISATVLEGNIVDSIGGWLSELRPEGHGRYRFVFKDRNILLMHSSSVVCAAKV
jgi:hypothetical protein